MNKIERESANQVNTDHHLAALLSRGETVEQAAKFVGVTPRTVYRRLATTEFKALMAEFRQIMFAAVAGRMSDALPEATETLRSLLRHDNPNIQYKAAVKLIEFALTTRDHAEVDNRVGKLDIFPGNINEVPQLAGDAQASPQTGDEGAVPIQEGQRQPDHNCAANSGTNPSA
jgi:hypothetical protein